jgi:hypothetical protein
LSLTPNCYVCGSNYRVNRYSKVENPLVVQQRYNEEHERKRIVLDEHLPQSSGSSLGTGSGGGSTNSTGGILYFGIGILFLAWLYFSNRSNMPSSQPRQTIQTTQTNTSDQVPINNVVLSIDQIKSDLVGTGANEMTIQSSNDLNEFILVDSIKTNEKLQYTATFELHKESEQFSRHHFRAIINYRILSNKWEYLDAQSTLIEDVIDKRDSNEIVAPINTTDPTVPQSINVNPSYSSGTNQNPIEEDSTNVEAPVIKWETQNIDYGKVIKGDENNATRYFKFTNVGKLPLIISACHGNCGCVVPSCPTETIIPGKDGEVKVHYDVNRIGNFTKTVTVYSNAKRSTSILQITGIVE